MARWLKAEELAIELGVGVRAVEAMRRAGVIQCIKTGGPELRAAYRFLDPGPETAQKIVDYWRECYLNHFAFITTQEVAEVVGISYDALRSDITIGKVVPAVRGDKRHPHLFTRFHVRQILAQREKLAGQRKFRYSEILVKWLRRWLTEQKTSTKTLNELLKQAVKLPEPRRSKAITRLWALFDEVNELLRECDES